MQNCKLIAIFNTYRYVYETTAEEKDGDEKYLKRHRKDINDNVDDDRSNSIVKEKEFSADIQSTINGGDVSTIIATVPFRNNESFLLINSD